VIRTKSLFDPVDEADGVRILIARFPPRWLGPGEEVWHEWIRDLGPSPRLLGAIRRGRIGWAAYALTFLCEMEGTRQKALIGHLAERSLEGEVLTLLCFCGLPSECHRSLVARLVCQVSGEPYTPEPDPPGPEQPELPFGE
jgi:uncharacterized protein YeaO (DUF488 family)